MNKDFEKQIKETFQRAFWDKLDQDIQSESYEHVNVLLEEIIQTLYSLVPKRPDIHEKIHHDLQSPVTWNHQEKLIQWIQKFQAPVYDKMTKEWLEQVPQNLSFFLKKYYTHLQVVVDETKEARAKLARGENIFTPNSATTDTDITSIRMKTGI